MKNKYIKPEDIILQALQSFKSNAQLSIRASRLTLKKFPEIAKDKKWSRNYQKQIRTLDWIKEGIAISKKK